MYAATPPPATAAPAPAIMAILPHLCHAGTLAGTPAAAVGAGSAATGSFLLSFELAAVAAFEPQNAPVSPLSCVRAEEAEL